MNVSFTVFTNNRGLLTKTATLTPEGELARSGATNLYDGAFETVTLPWSDFGPYLNTINHNQALSLGTCTVLNGGDKPMQRGRIVTRDMIARGNHDKYTLTRTKENFAWAAGERLIYFDVDKIEDEDQDCETVLMQILQDLPELGKFQAGFWLLPSSSSYLYHEEGQRYTGLRGLHIYTILPETVDIEKLKKYIKATYWLNGKAHFEVSGGYTPRLLDRYPLDLSVFDPSRLIYTAGSSCSGRLQQRRGDPLYVQSISHNMEIDLSVDITAAKIAEERARQADDIQQQLKRKEEEAIRIAADKCGISTDDAVKTIRLAKDGKVIPGSLVIHTDSKGEVKAWKILLEGKKWNNTTCRDPFEPDYDRGSKNKAVIYCDDEGTRIFSHAHGGSTRDIVMDARSVEEIVGLYTAEDLERMDSNWLRHIQSGTDAEAISVSESKKLLKKVAEKYRYDSVGDVKAAVEKAANHGKRDELQAAMQEMNEEWAIVTYGGKIRYMTERVNPETGSVETLYLQKGDFLDLHATNNVWVIAKGRKKKLNVAENWLKREGRREYQGTIFDPSTEEKVIHGNYYNTYRGLVYKAARTCDMKHCGGKGCTSYMFGQAHCMKPCPNNTPENWTWYIHHIYNQVCGRNIDHARWVVDWLYDVIANRGGKRPATCLCVRGGQGCGKGAVIQPLMKIVGQYSYHTSNIDDITDKFNVFMQSKLLLFADEAVWGGGHKAASRMKAIVSEEWLSVEPKGVDKFMARNLVRLYISSNAEWVVPAEEDERRFCVFNIGTQRRNDREYFEKIFSANLPALLWEMEHWERKSNIHKVLATDALQQQKQFRAMPPEVEFLFDSVDNGWFWDARGEGLVVTAEDFRSYAYPYYNTTKHAATNQRSFTCRLNAILRELGVETNKMRVSVGGKSLGATRWPPITALTAWLDASVWGKNAVIPDETPTAVEDGVGAMCEWGR